MLAIDILELAQDILHVPGTPNDPKIGFQWEFCHLRFFKLNLETSAVLIWNVQKDNMNEVVK